MKYSEPLSQLFSLDYPGEESVLDYKSLGITTEHITDLMRMATNANLLNSIDDEDNSGFCAAVHSWYALGQLQVPEIVPQLLDMVDQYDFDYLFENEYPRVFKLIGVSGISSIEKYIFDESKSYLGRSYGIESLKKLGEDYREECVAVLSDFLTKPSCPDLAGITVCALIDLEASEHIDVIRTAFNRGYVNIDISGDLEDVEIAFGIREKRSTPPPIYNSSLFEKMMPLSQISITQVRTEPKVGRNDPCPCGSGKKFKKCCSN